MELLLDFQRTVNTAGLSHLRFPPSRLYHQFLGFLAEAQDAFAENPTFLYKSHLRRLFALAFRDCGFDYVSFQDKGRFHTSKIILVEACAEELSAEDLALKEDTSQFAFLEPEFSTHYGGVAGGNDDDDDSYERDGSKDWSDLSVPHVPTKWATDATGKVHADNFHACLPVHYYEGKKFGVAPLTLLRMAAAAQFLEDFTSKTGGRKSRFTYVYVLEKVTGFTLSEVLTTDAVTAYKSMTNPKKTAVPETRDHCLNFLFQPNPTQRDTIDKLLKQEKTFTLAFVKGLTPNVARGWRLLVKNYEKARQEMLYCLDHATPEEPTKGNDAFIREYITSQIPQMIRRLFPDANYDDEVHSDDDDLESLNGDVHRPSNNDNDSDGIDAGSGAAISRISSPRQPAVVSTTKPVIAAGSNVGNYDSPQAVLGHTVVPASSSSVSLHARGSTGNAFESPQADAVSALVPPSSVFPGPGKRKRTSTAF